MRDICKSASQQAFDFGPALGQDAGSKGCSDPVLPGRDDESSQRQGHDQHVGFSQEDQHAAAGGGSRNQATQSRQGGGEQARQRRGVLVLPSESQVRKRRQRTAAHYALERFRGCDSRGFTDDGGNGSGLTGVDEPLAWEVNAALASPKRKIIRHRPDLTDEQIAEAVAGRSLRARWSGHQIPDNADASKGSLLAALRNS